MKVHELYKTVTAAVIRDLETGVPPWVRPWRDDKIHGVGMIPSNLVTGRLYSGGNILLLWMVASMNGYSNLQYCTYSQANSIGARVRKGEKAHTVLFTKHVLHRDEDDKLSTMSTMVKSFSVFNVAQLDGVDPQHLVPQQAPELPEGHSPRVILARGCGVPVQHGGNRACYVPSRDEVHMPTPKAFIDEDAYWQTLLHEFTHATSDKKRCDRKLGKRFGDEQYAVEEIIAELGSAFLCARLGMPAGFRSSSYIESWLKVLKGDSRAIFTAASHAGQAADWLWNTAFPKVEKQLEAAE